jgi:hypothetical protein
MRPRAIALLLGVAVLALFSHVSGGVASAKKKPSLEGPVVIALIDAGVNPYSPAFRDRSPLAHKHPSTYIPGYPKDAIALKITLDEPFDEALAKDEALWAGVARGKLYWFPGTRIVGGISFGGGGCPNPEAPPPSGTVSGVPCKDHLILDDNGHGTMTASRSGGAPASLAPNARIVEIEGLGAQGVRWAAESGWIDVQSNSWLSLVPQPVPQDTTEAFAEAATKMLTLAASGNGTAFILGAAPTPSFVLATAPAGVILVGAHDNGKMAVWSGSPPHVVADGYAGMTAIFNSVEPMRPDPIACCSSASSPYAAGGAAAIISEARRILGSHETGMEGGIVACGRPGVVASGPLADGDLTLSELREVFFHTAEAHPAEGRDDGEIHWAGDPRAPELTPYGPGDNPFCIGCTTMPIDWATIPGEGEAAYPLVGYGGINERSVALALDVLRGKADVPSRPNADQQFEADQTLRGLLSGTVAGESDSACAIAERK